MEVFYSGCGYMLMLLWLNYVYLEYLDSKVLFYQSFLAWFQAIESPTLNIFWSSDSYFALLDKNPVNKGGTSRSCNRGREIAITHGYTPI